ncbi:MAG: bacteriophage Gp15 family protein [Prevotella sp.]|nr:bacteriophage Gp15 family protein [Prevotella sp.]
MNILTDPLPNSLTVCGKTYPIHSDFRTGILFTEAVSDPDLSDGEKLDVTAKLYFGGFPFATWSEWEEAYKQILWFYRCGRDMDDEENGDSSGEESFSFTYDADYVYAAFLSAYGIDLTVQTLHWWQFMALLRAIPGETELSRIIGYRTMEIDPDMPRKQKQHYQKMKELFAIPRSKAERELEKSLTDVLMNGGDITTVLS